LAVDLLIQIAIFVLVFFVVAFAESALSAVFMVPLLLSNKAFMQQISGSFLDAGGGAGSPTIAELSNSITQSPEALLVMLFATIAGIVVVVLYCRLIEKRKVATLGLTRKHALREYLVGLAVGTLMFALVVALGVATGAMTYGGMAGASATLILLLLVAFMIQSMSEELLCRGYFLVSLANRQNLALAVFISSCLFGILHVFNAGVTPLAIVNIILFGLFAGVYMLKRGDIWGIGAVHAAWNFTQGSIFGINVSGLPLSHSVFSFTPVEGHSLISGGSFGMEAGLAATAVLIAALTVALLVRAKDPVIAPC
jgi:membrane protease YdiL (CAAX protease family)